ncbi:hypothetical protein GQ55_4G325900 [Panicum hallii var. hallii]|uniref:DUF295 domain-containing protein n=1 Tax=Panicum hallii var. hallii TaxID=1504633 RepID=A0A2T7E2F1_9POAL|nr:hypothetical protein GQ55_4G325900 [Panicum hallii var. hallii]
MDTTPSSHGGVRAPYPALKHAAGSDDPVFFNVSAKKAIITDITGELENSNYCATLQGWVLVRDTAAPSTYVLDPHDHRRRIHLSHLSEDDLPPVCTCLLSDHPDPADPRKRHYRCHIGSGAGGGEWVKHEYDIETLDLPDLGEGCKEKLVICSITVCDGRFYFNGSFDELSPMTLLSSKEFLVESGRELFMVSLLSPSDPAWSTGQKWHEAEDIGGRASQLSPWYFGASCPATECGLEANCFYVPYEGTKRLMVFNVKDRTMKMQDLDEAPISKQALWMLPTYP